MSKERIIYINTKDNEMFSNPNAFHGFSSEPTILPPVWDGKFAKAKPQPKPDLKPGERLVYKGTKDHELLSDASKYYPRESTTTVLPVVWDGTFAKSDEVYVKPSRNASNPDNFFERKSHTVVLPPAWDGTFAKSGETYTRPSRNDSDQRDYHELKNRVIELPPTWDGKFSK